MSNGGGLEGRRGGKGEKVKSRMEREDLENGWAERLVLFGCHHSLDKNQRYFYQYPASRQFNVVNLTRKQDIGVPGQQP